MSKGLQGFEFADKECYNFVTGISPMLLGKIIRRFMVFPLLFSAILPIFAPEINKCSNNPLKRR
jgi:hypothetical protein